METEHNLAKDKMEWHGAKFIICNNRSYHNRKDIQTLSMSSSSFAINLCCSFTFRVNSEIFASAISSVLVFSDILTLAAEKELPVRRNKICKCWEAAKQIIKTSFLNENAYGQVNKLDLNS